MIALQAVPDDLRCSYRAAAHQADLPNTSVDDGRDDEQGVGSDIQDAFLRVARVVWAQHQQPGGLAKIFPPSTLNLVTCNDPNPSA